LEKILFEIGDFVRVQASGAAAEFLVLGHDYENHLILGAMVSQVESLRSTRFREPSGQFVYPNIIGTFWDHQVAFAQPKRLEFTNEQLEFVRSWPFASNPTRNRIIANHPEISLRGSLDGPRSDSFYEQVNSFLLAGSEVMRTLDLGTQVTKLPHSESLSAMSSWTDVQKYSFVLAVTNSFMSVKDLLRGSNELSETHARLLLRQAVKVKSALKSSPSATSNDRIAAFFDLFGISTLLVDSIDAGSLGSMVRSFREKFPNFTVLEGI
jgi:hypothetical protein